MALLAATAVVLVIFAADRWYLRVRTESARAQVEAETRSAAETVSALVVRRISVLEGLAAFLRVNSDRSGLSADFIPFADGLRQGTSGLRTVQYLRDGVIQQTWPLEGNESVVGYDVLHSADTAVAAGVRRTLLEPGVVLSGPFALRQGGAGLVARLAVRDDTLPVRIIAAVVFDPGIIYGEVARLAASIDLDARLLSPNDSVLWASQPERTLVQPIRVPIRLASEQWILETAPSMGWTYNLATERRTLWVGGVALAVLLAGLVWTLEAWQVARVETNHLRQLHGAEERFALLFQLVPDGVSVVRVSDGVFMQVNDAYCEITGRTRGDLVGKTINESQVWASPDERDEAIAHLRNVGRLADYPFAVRRPDGSTRETLVSSRIVDLDGVQHYLTVMRDMHDRRVLERRVIESQRLEAIGRLAGGVAHDFNNLITAIGGYAELALGAVPASEDHRRDLLEIQRATVRAAELTRQLLTFARRQVVLPRHVDLARLVADGAPLLRQLAGDTVALVIDVPTEQVPVLVDPSQVEHALANLVVNARDAMPAGGQVTIGVGVSDGHPILTVRDTGVGIGADALPHIFEPFYTTKSPGRGTGLGLATVYGIVEQAGAQISVKSELGSGTSFRIIFPASDGAPTVEPAPSSKLLPTGTETILVVDDEAQIRDICARMLRRLGYTVAMASDGRRALEAMRGLPALSLVLTDVVMPGMGGLELRTELARTHPALRVVLTSGYSADVAPAGVEGVPFLVKPYTALDLATIIRETLDA